MQFLALTILILTIIVIFFLWQMTKVAIFKNKVAWSGKDIPIKRKQGIATPALLSEIKKQSGDFLKEEGFAEEQKESDKHL